MGDILRADAHCPPRAERVGSWRVLTESRSHLVAALPDGDRVASPSRRDAEAREASMSKGPRFAVPRGNFPQNPSKQRGCGVRRSQARRFDRRALAGKKRGGARNGSRGRGGDNVCRSPPGRPLGYGGGSGRTGRRGLVGADATVSQGCHCRSDTPTAVGVASRALSGQHAGHCRSSHCQGGVPAAVGATRRPQNGKEMEKKWRYCTERGRERCFGGPCRVVSVNLG